MTDTYCYDSIIENIPHDAQACLGYVGGMWPTAYAFERDFPALARQGRVISCAINAYERARCLDIEHGDAEPYQAPGWYRDYADHAHGPPILYGSASITTDIDATMSRAGHGRSEYLILSAHYGYDHICGPSTCGYPQADGTQFTDVAHGLNLDESHLGSRFFAPPPRPPDPYRFFATEGFPVPTGWHDRIRHRNLAKVGDYLQERPTVIEYDRLMAHPWENRFTLHVVRQELLFLRKRLWVVAHDTPDSHGHPSWGFDWRGVRFQELLKRTEGVHQEW